jgi:hypothetical protein
MVRKRRGMPRNRLTWRTLEWEPEGTGRDACSKTEYDSPWCDRRGQKRHVVLFQGSYRPINSPFMKE